MQVVISAGSTMTVGRNNIQA